MVLTLITGRSAAAAGGGLEETARVLNQHGGDLVLGDAA